MFEFKLPDLGEGIQEGEILEWHVSVGDNIKEDDPLVDIETDKAAVNITSPRGGRIVSLAGKEGDTVNVGEILVVIDDGSGGEASVSADKAEKQPEQDTKAEVTQAEQSLESKEAKPVRNAETVHETATVKKKASTTPSLAVVRTPGRPVPAAPATRRLARELGIEINKVPATGPGGRITPDDVRRFATGGVSVAAEALPPDEAVRTPLEIPSSGIPFFTLEELPDFAQWGETRREPVRSIRRKVARKMVTSMVLVPHVSHMDEVDVTRFEEYRRARRVELEGTPGGKLTLLPFVMKALTILLKKYPMFNASLDPFREEIVYKHFYNLGFAADTDRGLVVPVVKNTDEKSILQISAEIETLAEKARNGKLAVDDMRGGTITITNIGPLGGTGLIPTINYPEVAIIGMGRATEKPVVRNGEIVIRTMLPLTMTFDHRIADGAQAARMMTELIHFLTEPNNLLLEI